MPAGDTARKLMAKAHRRHPNKDSRTWELRTVVPGPAGVSTVLKQQISEYTKVEIFPIVDEINEHEAAHLGANLLSGDLRLRLDGLTEYELDSSIYCDGDPFDVKKIVRLRYKGAVTGHKIYGQVRERKTGS